MPTIAEIRHGHGLDFRRYVARTFRTADAAHRYLNNLGRPATVVIIERSVRAGDAIDPTERVRTFK